MILRVCVCMCVSHSITVKGQCDQCNSYKRKHLIRGLFIVSEV